LLDKWIQAAKRRASYPQLIHPPKLAAMPVSREPNAQEKPSMPKVILPVEPKAEPIVLEISGLPLCAGVSGELLGTGAESKY
jgi:hypothetical protein